MKYKDVDILEARECCKYHHKKDKKGNLYSDCDHCPLRRDKLDKEGVLRHLFCWFVLAKMLEDVQEEMDELNAEEIQYEKEWKEWIELTNKTVL